MYGSDQAASLEVNGMRQLLKLIRSMEKSLGIEKVGHITKEEIKISEKLRQHLKYEK